MVIEDKLQELKEQINRIVPGGITVSDVEFEGPELVIYTDDPKQFADQADLIKILARDLRKRIVVRPNILEDPGGRRRRSGRLCRRTQGSPRSSLTRRPARC